MCLSRRSTLLKNCLIGLLLCSSQYLQAQTLYTVEVIIFERKGLARTLGSNLATSDMHLAYPANLRVLIGPENSSPSIANELDTLIALPSTAHNLNTQAAALAGSKQMRVLFHQSWRQPMGDGNSSLAIAGGNRFGEHQELEGYLTFNADKGLVINLQLWLAQFMPDNGQPMPTSFPLPPLPSAAARPPTQNAPEFIATWVVPMELHQKLKMGEIHYLDHPVLGGLIKVYPGDN